MLTLDELTKAYANHIWLEFDEATQKKAWSHSRVYSNNTACWKQFLNQLCREILIPELAVVSEAEASSIRQFGDTVEGIAISLGKMRLVLIPSDTIDTEEFAVPQEWVDIPSWLAPYYLAVQINPSDRWLRVWGYATYQQLKQQGRYEKLDRTYCLEGSDLIDNLNVLWVAQELSPVEIGSVSPLPQLSEIEARDAISRLANSHAPRLALDFVKWGALLENETWREQLYQQRLREKSASVSRRFTALSRWFDNAIEQGWQTIEELFGTSEAQLAWRYHRFGEEDINNPKTISKLIAQIYSSPHEHRRKLAAKKLGTIRTVSREAVEALVHLIKTTNSEETRWTAAESLWMLEPRHPAGGVRRGIDLGMLLSEKEVALTVGILPKNDEKVAILLRVYPMRASILPPGLQLVVLDETDKVFLQAQARDADNCIQLKFFGRYAEEFAVKIILGEAEIVESFVI